VNHVTLENELMPIAEVVPYQGGYYLAIVNTGYEPFTVRQVYLKGGSTLSVNTKPLTHNQWFFEQTNQLPIAVRVCSAIDPRVCEVVPVHGWSTIDPTSILGNSSGSGLIGLAEQAAVYLYHWVAVGVNGINFPAYGVTQGYVGVIIELGSNYYLLSMGSDEGAPIVNSKQVIPIGAIGVPFLVGPLNNTNSVVLGDYGYGHAGCTYVYPHNCPPTPPGGSNDYFSGSIPTVTLNQGNIAITIPQGDQFTNLGPHPDYPTEAVVYLLTQDAQFYEYLVVFSISGTVMYCPNLWTCYSTNVNGAITYYPYKPQSNYQIVPISVESSGALSEPVTINVPQPPTNNYYVILVVWANNSEFPAWFAWHIANNTVNWPQWLSSQTTNIIEPQQYNNPSINT
jgi:hypothetical protein